MIGKTEKDMLSGAKLRNYHNKRLRAEWSRASKDRPKGGRVEIDFPVQTCNGKKNRYRTTGKNGTTVFNKDVKH